MFSFVLVILLSGEAPKPVATFNSPSMCLYMATVINKSDIDGKAVCVEAVKHGEI